MSILILVKGMKMPTSCTDCFFAIKDKITMCGDKDCDYKVKLSYNCHFKPDEIEDGWVGIDIADKKRQEWCPLKEVKHGHWDGGFHDYYCSVCGQGEYTKTNYCSNCGAKTEVE